MLRLKVRRCTESHNPEKRRYRVRALHWVEQGILGTLDACHVYYDGLGQWGEFGRCTVSGWACRSINSQAV
jgi:hypothetical protein